MLPTNERGERGGEYRRALDEHRHEGPDNESNVAR